MYTDIKKRLRKHGRFLFELWLILLCKGKKLKCKPGLEENVYWEIANSLLLFR